MLICREYCSILNKTHTIEGLVKPFKLLLKMLDMLLETLGKNKSVIELRNFKAKLTEKSIFWSEEHEFSQ